MKKIRIILFFLMGVLLISIVPVFSAEKDVLEAKDYIDCTKSDVTSEMISFLTECERAGKNAFFNDGVYAIHGKIPLKTGVSILGDRNTVFYGNNPDYQAHLLDGTAGADILIQDIVFDNVSIYFQQPASTRWTIQRNVFMNAKKLDISQGYIDPGLEPDSSNMNGGPSTGYYILSKNNTVTIQSNLFLRDKNSLGRGIGLYRTQNSVIQDNYFGMLEDVDQSMVSLTTKNLKAKALPRCDTSSNQGYFMTGINVINGDQNTLIYKNFFSFNKDLCEGGYEDQSQKTLGYHRDHLIYAKEFSGLQIIANYFKGQNKNADGGVKCRNGNDLVVYKNIFEDSLLLLYVQDSGTKNDLKNVFVCQNIFLNQDYTNESISVNDKTKFLTCEYLILLMNYVENAELENITISQNTFYSFGLSNEKIVLDYTNKTTKDTNLTIEENFNLSGQKGFLKILNMPGRSPSEQREDFKKGTKYEKSLPQEFLDLSVDSFLPNAEIPFKIVDQRIVVDHTDIYLNGIRYNASPLSKNQRYHLFFSQETEIDIFAETQSKRIPSYRYGEKEFSVEVPSEKEIRISSQEQWLDLAEWIENIGYYELSCANHLVEGTKLHLSGTNETVDVSVGGFPLKLKIVCETLLNDFTASSSSVVLSEGGRLSLDYEEGSKADFTFEYDPSALKIDSDTLEIKAFKVGTFFVRITERFSQISKTIPITVLPNDIDYELSVEQPKVFERFAITVKINGKVSTNYKVLGLQKEGDLFYATQISTQAYIVDLMDETNQIPISLNLRHYYDFSCDSNIEMHVGDVQMITYTLQTSDPEPKLQFQYDGELIEVDETGRIVALKEGETTLKIVLKNGQNYTINVKIVPKTTNFLYIFLPISIVFVIILSIVSVILVKKFGKGKKKI